MKKDNKSSSVLRANAPASLENQMFYGLTLDEEQKKFRDTIYDKEKLIILCNAKAGTGKAQPLFTPIPTPFGTKKISELKVGDHIYDRCGKLTEVLGIYPQGKQKAVIVSLEDGRETICSVNHLWTYRKNNKMEVDTASDIMRMIDDGETIEIPMNKAIVHSKKDFTTDPYLIGSFVGNRKPFSDYLAIKTTEKDVVKYIERLTDSNAEKIKEGFYYFKSHSTKQYLKISEVFDENIVDRIPEKYFYGSIEQRLELLQGILDNHGYWLKQDDKYVIRVVTTNDLLAVDIANLATSLGLITNVDGVYETQGNFKYLTIDIRIPAFTEIGAHKIISTLFKFSKNGYFKDCDDTNLESFPYYMTSKNQFIKIVSIEPLKHEEKMACLYVDNNEHLYLTNDYIVTHNTTISLGVANLLVQYGFYNGIVYIISPTMEQKQGFLPGDQNSKSAPYMEPLIEALYTLNLDPKQIIKSENNLEALKNGTAYIDFTADTYLRGCNFENKVVIIDEAQNFYFDELKKTLTRIHDNCKTIVIGHDLQCDLYKKPERSGFSPYLKAFKNIDDPRAAVCELTINHRGWVSTFCDNVEM